MGWHEDDALLLVAGKFAQGKPIVDSEYIEPLRNYQAMTGVLIDDMVHEALDTYIECDLSVMVEAIAERAAQG